MKKVFVVLFIALLWISQAHGDVLLSNQTTNTDGTQTEVTWSGGNAIVTLDGGSVLDTAVVGVQYKPSGASNYTKVYRDVKISYSKHLFSGEDNPQSAIVAIPTNATVQGYVLEATTGGTTNVTLRIEH